MKNKPSWWPNKTSSNQIYEDGHREGSESEAYRVKTTLHGHLNAIYDMLRISEQKGKLRDSGRQHAALTARYEMVRHLLRTLYPDSVVYLTPDEVEAQKIAERESGR